MPNVLLNMTSESTVMVVTMLILDVSIVIMLYPPYRSVYSCIILIVRDWYTTNVVNYLDR